MGKKKRLLCIGRENGSARIVVTFTKGMNAPACISKNKAPVSDALSAPDPVVAMLRKSEIVLELPSMEVMPQSLSSVLVVLSLPLHSLSGPSTTCKATRKKKINSFQI